MAGKLTTSDPAAALADDTEIAFFMADALATGDSSYIAKCVGIVARAKGMAEIASQTGLSGVQFHRSISENGNPTLKTTVAVRKALEIELTAKLRMRRKGRYKMHCHRNLHRNLRDPSRIAAILEGLRMAGLPES